MQWSSHARPARPASPGRTPDCRIERAAGHRQRQYRRTVPHRRGATLVWVAVMMFVLIGFVALAMDWGYAYYTTQKLQNAADAAALAGAQRVWESHGWARSAAQEYASSNEAGGAAVLLDPNYDNAPNGDVVIGVYDTPTRTFTPSADETAANAVLVDAKRREGSPNGPLGLAWGGIFGINATEFSRWAIAVAEGGPHNADIIALNARDKQSFYIFGNGHLDVGEGVIQVNSSHLDGSTFQGSSLTLIAGAVDMVSTEYETRGNPALDDVALATDQKYVPDPYAELPEPVPGEPMFPPKISGYTEFHPGYYPQGLYMNDSENVFLHPGVYIIDNGWHTNGHATLTGYGVMFFIRTGGIQHNGTGDIHITPPTEGVYKGIQFFQARDNTTEAHFNGTGLLTGATVDDPATEGIDESTQGAGTFYFPNATTFLNGTGDMFFRGLVADKIVIGGSGRKTVTGGYDGDRGGDKVWLVE
jgi:Flp pilus assembly protein TadG